MQKNYTYSKRLEFRVGAQGARPRSVGTTT